jgi:hypothetical protein
VTTRPETPRERAEREALERAVSEVPLHGRPLPKRARLGPETLERYLAAVGGPLTYMRRLRLIEVLVHRHEHALRERWQALAAEERQPARFRIRWQRVARRWDFADVNELVDSHNRWYPVEARLPMDPRTGDYRLVGGRPYTRLRLDARWVLALFPASLERARAGCSESVNDGLQGQQAG